MAKLSFGINVNTRAVVLFPKEYPASKLLEMAAKTEELGYHSVWVGDNFFAKARLESINTLSAVAARTKRVKLGTAALISTLRNPVWLALEWGTMDLVSEGRSILGICVGGGSPEAAGPEFLKEFEVAGVPYHERGRLFEEQIEIIKRLWTEERITFEGKYYKLKDVSVRPKPAAKPRPPIWISNNPQVFTNIKPQVYERMMKRVARMADGWMSCTAYPDQYRQHWNNVLKYAKEFHRSSSELEPSQQVIMTINPSRERALKEATDFINRYYGSKFETIEKSFWNSDPFGNTEHVVEKLEALVEAGCRTFIVRFATPDQFGQLQKFTKDILPSFI